jgi:hypothetical protein
MDAGMARIARKLATQLYWSACDSAIGRVCGATADRVGGAEARRQVVLVFSVNHDNSAGLPQKVQGNLSFQ